MERKRERTADEKVTRRVSIWLRDSEYEFLAGLCVGVSVNRLVKAIICEFMVDQLLDRERSKKPK